MGACADALRELRGIAQRLNALGSFGNEQGLQSEQINVVRLIEKSPCPALNALASHVRFDKPEQVLLAWRALVVDGLEPAVPTLPKVAAIQAQSSGGVVRPISTSETTVNGVAVPVSAPGVPMNLWVDHARRVVGVLIARVEQAAKAEPDYQPTGSKIPELVAELKAVAAGLPAVLEGNRAGFERVAGVIESLGARDDDDRRPATLPELDARDTEAWQASLVAGMTQAKIADALNRKYPGENWTQPRVSEAIGRAKAHAEASGLADKVSGAHSRAPARTMDPAAAEQGKRMDGKAHHLRERERQKAKDGDDEE